MPRLILNLINSINHSKHIHLHQLINRNNVHSLMDLKAFNLMPQNRNYMRSFKIKHFKLTIFKTPIYLE